MNYNIVTKLNTIYYNMSLFLMKAQKFDEAYEYLTLITENTLNRYKIWYKLGICIINSYHNLLKETNEQKDNSIYQATIGNYPPKYTIQPVPT